MPIQFHVKNVYIECIGKNYMLHRKLVFLANVSARGVGGIIPLSMKNDLEDMSVKYSLFFPLIRGS